MYTNFGPVSRVIEKFRCGKPLCYTGHIMALYPAELGFHRHRNEGKLREWRRLVLLAYVALLAFVMPFICWGAWAEPGHLHGSPHFVFATPPGPGDAISTIVWSLQSYCGTPPSDAPAAGSGGEADPAAVAGQSLPDTTLMVTLLLILLVGWLQLEDLRQYAERVKQVCAATPFASLVPTPPPRMA